MISSIEALKLSEHLVAQRYADADVGFAAGSIFGESATPYSDLDMVVVHPKFQGIKQECFHFEGVLFEIFECDWDGLLWCLDAEQVRGIPLFVNIVGEGRLVGPRPWMAESVKIQAQGIVKRGPLALSKGASDDLRYNVSDLVDDLRGGVGGGELVAIGCRLYDLLADLALRGSRRWAGGGGKWTSRRLSNMDPALGNRFTSAFSLLFAQGDRSEVLQLAEDILASNGGRLAEGYSKTSLLRTGP